MVRPLLLVNWLLFIGLSVGLSLPNAPSTLDEDTDTDDNDTYECPSPRTLQSIVARGLQANPPEWALTNLCSTSKHIPFQPASYEYDDSAGAGVDIYVFDTGIEHDQTQFGTRVVDEVNESDEPFKDLAGHGTKVASLIASKDYGIAKSANLYSVKFRENGKPNSVRFVQAMTKVIDLHNVRKTQTGFKGSIINMSFKLSRTAGIVQALDDAHAAGISLVASSGNKGYKSNHWPSAHPNVISVGGNTKTYKPRYVSPTKGSNFGKDEIDIWAPGEDVAVLDQNGFKRCGSGTSYASAYVSGILAIFYGVEGSSLTPDGARDLLFANSDNYIDLTPTQPSGAPVDWHNSPTIMANTGYLKGQALSPKVPFLPKSVPPSLQPATAPVAGCQSPNHEDPLRPFTLDQGDAARSYFIAECQGVELSPGKVEGCVAYFNPCSEKFGAKAVSVILSMQQISWKDGTESEWADRQEMADAAREIMNNCDTNTVQEKWGGFKSIEVDSGVRMYNVTANQNGQYPTISDRWATRAITSGQGDCDTWNSD